MPAPPHDRISYNEPAKQDGQSGNISQVSNFDQAKINQLDMKALSEIKQNFKSDPSLEYVDIYIFSNNSCYRGQMKKIIKLTNQERQNLGEIENKDLIRHGYGL
jgi:hypothetical protein